MGYIGIHQGIILILYLVDTYGAVDLSAYNFCSEVCEHWAYCTITKDAWICASCKKSTFYCMTYRNGPTCIPESLTCDGTGDCHNNTDEWASTCANRPKRHREGPLWFGISPTAFWITVLFVVGLFASILYMIVWCYKKSCLSELCRQWREEAMERRDNPPDYSTCVSPAFISDSPEGTQASIEDALPSYSSVITGEGIIMHPGQLCAMYQPQPDGRSSNPILEAAQSLNVKPVIAESSEDTKRDEQQEQ